MARQMLLGLTPAPNDQEPDLDWIEERRRVDGCALINGWCWTHEVRDDMRHHFDVHPDAYND